MKAKFLILFSLTVYFVASQVPRPNKGCPDYSYCTDPNLNYSIQEVKGYYYLYASVPYFFQIDRKCTYFNMTTPSPGVIHFDKVSQQNETNKIRHNLGYLTISPDGYINTAFTELGIALKFKLISYTFDYVILVICHDCGVFSSEGAGSYAMALTKLAIPPCEIEEAIKQKLANCGITENYLKMENQKDCETTCAEPPAC